jgi:hypothetical protein
MNKIPHLEYLKLQAIVYENIVMSETMLRIQDTLDAVKKAKEAVDHMLEINSTEVESE